MIGASNRVLLSVSLVIVAVGALDAFLGREWDLLVLFAMVGAVQLWLLGRHVAHRRHVTLRADLTVALEHRADRNGEPFDDVLDRSVAASLHGLFPTTGSGR